MKLIEILKRDLKTWPKGAAFAVQDSEKGTTVKFAGHKAKPVGVALLGSEGVWQSNGWDFGTKGDFVTELAEDWAIARVTEAMWKGETLASTDPHSIVAGEVIRQMAEVIASCGSNVEAAEALYDAGYRKFEIVEEDV